MAERVQALGGRLRMEPAAAGGTELRAWLPLTRRPQPAADHAAADHRAADHAMKEPAA